jgi:hypothetical protein
LSILIVSSVFPNATLTCISSITPRPPSPIFQWWVS